jgi:hypothetical protein
MLFNSGLCCLPIREALSPFIHIFEEEQEQKGKEITFFHFSRYDSFKDYGVFLFMCFRSIPS